MEFKVTLQTERQRCLSVDIGTEWNLKIKVNIWRGDPHLVDIGTEWNLKGFCNVVITHGAERLI